MRRADAAARQAGRGAQADRRGACRQCGAARRRAHAALYNRGNALAALGRTDEALASYGEALALRPDYAAALLNRAQLLQRLGRPREALASFERAFALMPASADALIARGNAHYAMKSSRPRLPTTTAPRRCGPTPRRSTTTAATRCASCGRREDALAAFDRALALKPDYAEAHNNRGNAALELNRVTEALAGYERALALKPDFVDALVNRGNALRYLARPQDAIASFDRALALNPQLPEAHWNKGLACLSLGDFARGWQGYEWRWRRSNSEMTPRDFAQPQWRGEDLRGRTILLHAEQGFGDSIQFIRYLPMVAAKGAKVILEIPDDLRPLIRIDGVAAILRRGDALPNFDLHCPLMSFAARLRHHARDHSGAGAVFARAGRARGKMARASGRHDRRRASAWSGRASRRIKNDTQPQHSPGAACAAAGAAGRHFRQPAKGPPRGRPRGARAKPPSPASTARSPILPTPRRPSPRSIW